MAVIPSGTLQQLINMVDVTTPTTRAKPAGVTGSLIVRKIVAAGQLIPEPEDCTLLGFYTRTPFYITEFVPADTGKIGPTTHAGQTPRVKRDHGHRSQVQRWRNQSHEMNQYPLCAEKVEASSEFK